MLDRVAAALVLMVLLLFSATAALACSECHHDTAQCLVSLELQAEEVLNTDLDIVASLGSEYDWAENASECSTVENEYLISEEGIDHSEIVPRAAGVSMDLESTHDLVMDSGPKGRHGVGV